MGCIAPAGETPRATAAVSPRPGRDKITGIDISSVATGLYDKFHGIAALGDKIFAAPCNADKLLEYQPGTGRLRGIDISSVATGRDKFHGIAALGDKIFAAPCNADKLLEYEYETPFAVMLLSTESELEHAEDAWKFADLTFQSEVARLEEQVDATRQELGRIQQELHKAKAAREKVQHALRLRRQAESGHRCSFWFIEAEKLRKCADVTLPAFQGLRKLHCDWLVKRCIGLDDAMNRSCTKSILTCSHRWENKECPDPRGSQLKALKDHLVAHPEIEYVWYDFWCLPQGARNLDEQRVFEATLPNINLLYLSTSVLLLIDLTYPSRFWTQFEAWLSLQSVTTAGLERAAQDKVRATVVPLHSVSSAMAQAFIDGLKEKNLEEAHKALGNPDVEVTNASDKTVQLKKLMKMGEAVRSFVAGREEPGPM